MSSHYRSLSHTLSNEGDEPSLKRAKYARQSAEKSASEDSYDGPIVRQSQHSATSLDYFPTQYHALTNCSAAEIQLWQSCQSEAVDLAGEEGVATSVVTTMSVAADSGLLQQPALVIHVPSADHEDMWRPLIISICKMLHVKDCLNLGVVIIAPPPPSSTSQFYSVRSNDPLVHLWPKLSYLKVIGKAPWSVVTVLLVGESLAQAKPTIVICTTDPNNDQWTAIEKNLKDMCREHGAGDINTLILKSSDPMLSIGELTPSGTAEQHTWTKTVESGASIGVAAKGSGTVGGHLKLLYADGKTEIVGTTNYHVIRPDHATVVATGFELLNEAWDSKYDKGEAHFDGNSPYSRAQVPSVFDHVAQQLNIQERRKKYQEELDELAHFKAKIDAGLANERTQNLYMRTQNLRDNIDVEHNRWLEPHQATATQFELATRSPSSTEAWVATHHTDLIYGEVKYTSGFRKDPAFDHRLDWALIAVAPSRNAGRNQLPSQAKVSDRFDFMGKKFVQGFGNPREPTPLSHRNHFIKIGRTTGLTEGTYSSIMADVSLARLPNSDYSEGVAKRAGADVLVSREHYIIKKADEKPVGTEGPKKAFSMAGDSGSWVITEDGYLMGIIWGSQGLPDLYSFFTPIDVVLKDIQMRTGCKEIQLVN